MRFRQHLMLYVLVPLSLFALAGSLYRFVIADNYIVTYQGECDPLTASCFVGCEDDACTAPHYYAWVQKRAADAEAECGPDVSGCAAASVCTSADTACTITYCSSNVLKNGEACETLGARGHGTGTSSVQTTLPASDKQP